MDARHAALNTLIAYRREGAWSEAHLRKIAKANDMPKRDVALASNICYGVLQNALLLDFYISCFSNVKKINPKIRDILRIAVYQIIKLDRIPDSAAINEAVKMAKRGNLKASGFVNAILRKISAQKENLPQPVGGSNYKLSILTSHPLWLVDKYIDIFGAEAEKILYANNQTPPIYARVNSVLTESERVISLLSQEGVEAHSHEWLENCIIIKNPGNIEELSAYRNGLITVQDVASQIAGIITQAKNSQDVLDVCAAPGGKSFVMAQQMQNEGSVTSCDIHPHKIELLEKGAKRLKLDCVTPVLSDATLLKSEWKESFDVVLADVPCSGLGIIRKKPDIRYKDPDELSGLPQLQKKILFNASQYVKPGGTLVYSTCTVLPEENEDVIKAFLTENPCFELVGFEIEGADIKTQGYMTFLPHKLDTDGFFICKMRKKD